MTTSYEILQLVCEQKIPSLTNVVSGVHLRLTATNGSNTRSSVVFVPIHVDTVSNSFVNFEDLSDATVRSWIDAQTDLMNGYITNLEIALTEASDPVVIAKDPPWAPPAPVPASEPSYRQLRRSGFPFIGDQLDMLWHAMDSGTLPKVTDFYDAIKAVKDQYPKT